MSTIQYSRAFESAVSTYYIGDPNGWNDEIATILYEKLDHMRSFFEFSSRYFDLSGKNFIEVGCGTGYTPVVAYERGAHVASTDFVERCVELTRMRADEHGIATDDLDLFWSDIRNPVATGRRHAYDVVFCNQVLEHIPRAGQFAALRTLFDYVAPGGFLFIDSENAFCPYDRHDTRTWLVRLLAKPHAASLIQALGRQINFLEPSAGEQVPFHDYLSYDEIIGAATIMGFTVVDPFMPHGSKKQYLRATTGSDWLHDTLGQYFDIEHFTPICLLLQKQVER